MNIIYRWKLTIVSFKEYIVFWLTLIVVSRIATNNTIVKDNGNNYRWSLLKTDINNNI